MQSNQPATIEQFDFLCQQAFQATSEAQRGEAECRLRYYFPTFAETPAEIQRQAQYGGVVNAEGVMEIYPDIKGPSDSARHLVWLLQNSIQVFSRAYSLQRLRIVILNHIGTFSAEDKLSLQNTLFNFIKSDTEGMNTFILTDTARILALIILFSWHDVPESKKIFGEINEFSKISHQHQLVALRATRTLVDELGRDLPSRYMMKQRRVVTNFRDRFLHGITKNSFAVMKDILSGSLYSDLDIEKKKEILSEDLELQKACLSFDFIGLASDESSDEATSIQVPSSWRDTFMTPGFFSVYFEGYQKLDSPICSQFIEILALLSSIRRSFFVDANREKFLDQMMTGIMELIKNGINMKDIESYHHTCRLLSRFGTIHAFYTIDGSEKFSNFVMLATNFTLEGFNVWEMLPNSITPLLIFWSKLATELDKHVTQDSESKLANFQSPFPMIVKSYLSTMLAAPAKLVSGDLSVDDPLDNEDEMIINVKMLSIMARTAYTDCSGIMVSLLEQATTDYQSKINSSMTSPDSLMILEGKYTDDVTYDDDEKDAELAFRCIQLDNIVREHIIKSHRQPSEHLELAIMFFYNNFRVTYLSDQGYKQAKMFSVLSGYIQINDSEAGLELVMQKIIFNLEIWPHSSPIVQRTLQILYDMTIGYSSLQQLAKLSSVQTLLDNHSTSGFKFLESVEDKKPRIKYYNSLCRIRSTRNLVHSTFESFTKHWAEAIDNLNSMSNEQFSHQPTRTLILKVLYDLRGFLSAITTKNFFALFFNWIFPSRIVLIHKVLALWKNDIVLQIAALRFIKEFTQNTSQRLTFDVSSPNGILMFREASKAVWEYGNLKLKDTNVTNDVYKERYKGFGICFSILTNLLTGRYVPIGVMPLYGDTALTNMFDITIGLLKAIPISDIIDYPKLGRLTFQMLDVLLQKTTIDLITIEENTYEHIIQLCSEALNHVETAIVSHSCSVIDGLCSYAIKQQDEPTPLSAIILKKRDILQFLCRELLNIVLFEDRPNDWSLLRPVFSLLMLEKEYMVSYTNWIAQFQDTERRDILLKSLSPLFDCGFDFSNASRDRFTQAMSQYRRDIASKNIVLMLPTNQTQGQSVGGTQESVQAGGDTAMMD
ncbi:hypothetical protein H4219_000113 [Mycoemilia scoparia]|uniref:Exportin-7/Ran-binding protein 17 TPR repeats domain-containing protein n=1 Tax=Mycoemilia scoparia TaxID=417184 RepID=A0A9W8A9E7_9FUNG|nr:hypothetical protein H4219_000113 [Mycoemilia scoparia]